MNTLEQLRNVLLLAQLPHSNTRQLISVFSYLREAERKDLLELLQQQPQWIKKLSQAIQQKQKVLATGNLELWKEYIAAEEQALVQLAA